MYSPKIREDLIPKIYHLAKAKRLHMTTLVNEILDEAVKAKYDIGKEEKDNETAGDDGGIGKTKAVEVGSQT